MRRLVFLAACLWLLSQAPAQAQGFACPGQNGPYVNYAREVLTISSTALPFTATVYQPSGAPPPLAATVTLETNPIRISTNGVPPTATVGTLWTNATNTRFLVCGEANVKRYLAIRTGSDASTTIEYWN